MEKLRKVIILIILIFSIITSGCVSSPVYETINQKIVDSVIPVNSKSYVYYQFSVPSQASISGDFTAYGGSGNDIQVIILDETAYINWINDHSVSTYYNSGQMTTGRITANVPQGKYFLIYSNKFSTLSNKNVKTKVDVSYTTCVQNC